MDNFTADDARNGTLDQLFRRAGINDVQNYVDEVREETRDVTLSNPTKQSHGKNMMANAKQVYQFVREKKTKRFWTT